MSIGDEEIKSKKDHGCALDWHCRLMLAGIEGRPGRLLETGLAGAWCYERQGKALGED